MLEAKGYLRNLNLSAEVWGVKYATGPRLLTMPPTGP
jgi:hypothetical protein